MGREHRYGSCHVSAPRDSADGLFWGFGRGLNSTNRVRALKVGVGLTGKDPHVDISPPDIDSTPDLALLVSNRGAARAEPNLGAVEADN